MEGCIFCDIVNEKSKAHFLYRDDLVSVFMDIFPLKAGHILVIPNKHAKRFSDIDPLAVERMFKTAQTIIKAIEKSEVLSDGHNLFLSDGEVAGQEVGHSHLHILPRYKSDGLVMKFLGAQKGKSCDNELKKMADHLTSFLPKD